MGIQKIVSLIKRSHGQPVLFHKLHNHLTAVLKTSDPLREISDGWSRVLVYSAIRSRNSNQSLETKILELLKKMRPPLVGEGNRLKLWIILYYMKNRESDQMNHMILFELVENFLGVSTFTDGLIVSVFISCILGSNFGLSRNKKLGNDSIVHLLGTIKNSKFDILNVIRTIPCYTQYDLEPPRLSMLSVRSDVVCLQAMECVCFYAKYAKHVHFAKSIVPEGSWFVESLRKFLLKSFKIENIEYRECSIRNGAIEDIEIFEKIRKAYLSSQDKEAFVFKVVEFVTNLKNE